MRNIIAYPTQQSSSP